MTYSFKEKSIFWGIFFILPTVMLFYSPTVKTFVASLLPSAMLTGIIFAAYRQLKIERYDRLKKELISATYRSGGDTVDISLINTPVTDKPSTTEKILDTVDNLISLIGTILVTVPFIFGIGRLLVGAGYWLKDGYWTSYTTCNVFGYFCINTSKWNGVNIILNRLGESDPTIFLLICIPIGYGLKAMVNDRSNISY
jgi:hypothetical protein